MNVKNLFKFLALLLKWMQPIPTHQKLKNLDRTQPNPWITLRQLWVINLALALQPRHARLPPPGYPTRRGSDFLSSIGDRAALDSWSASHRPAE